MKITEKIMGMPAIIEVLDEIEPEHIDDVLDYLHKIDTLFSAYKKDSEISKLNRNSVRREDLSPIVKKVLKLCDQNRITSHGYFNASYEKHIDVSGLLTGFAITEASDQLLKKNYKNFYIAIGHDMEIHGLKNGQKWKVAIQNPVILDKPKILQIHNKGVSTSTLEQKGLPMYNPVIKKVANALSLVTVIANASYKADWLSTASFAMGIKAFDFLSTYPDIEAFIVERDGTEKMTEGFASYM